jgi:hypothetical protein
VKIAESSESIEPLQIFRKSLFAVLPLAVIPAIPNQLLAYGFVSKSFVVHLMHTSGSGIHVVGTKRVRQEEPSTLSPSRAIAIDLLSNEFTMLEKRNLECVKAHMRQRRATHETTN